MWCHLSLCFDHVFSFFSVEQRNKQICLPGEKKSNLFLFFLEYFLFPGSLMFFYYSFHRWLFLFSNFTFRSCGFIDRWAMSYIFATFDAVRGVCGHIKVSWDNHSNCLSCSSFSRYLMCLICETWSATIWDLADKSRLYCSRRSTMTKKRYAKKKKNATLDLSDDNSTKDGITTLHCSTDGGRPQSGGIYMDGHIIQSMSTRHQSPVTGHQSSSPVTSHWALVTGHQSPVIQALVIEW